MAKRKIGITTEDQTTATSADSSISPNSSENRRLHAEQVKLLYMHAPVGLVATLVNSVILTFIQWEFISHSILITWLACVWLITLLRSVLGYRYRQGLAIADESSHWGIWFIIGTACSGVVWGSSGILLFPGESIAHQAFLAFLLGGMTAGGVAVYSPLKGAFLAFILPNLVPITVRFFTHTDDMHIAMGGMVLLFTVLMLVAARRMHAVTLTSLKLRFENNDLIADLTTEKEQTEELNEQLRSEITERKRAESLQADQNRVLELLATGRTLADVLTVLIHTIEVQAPGMRCSVLLLDRDGTHLHHCVAPGLPEKYTREIDGLEIGPSVGSCGTAAYQGKRIIVEDIAIDPLWVDFRELALEHGLRACWSDPIFSTNGHVLGTFAMYYRQPHKPSINELQLVEIASHLAGLAIERTQVEETLRQSEERFRRLFEQSSDAIFIHTLDGRMLDVNNRACEMLGYDMNQLLTLSVKSLYPEVDRPTLREALQTIDETGSIQFESRFKKAHGMIINVEISSRIIDHEKGIIQAIVRDITERVQSEKQIQASLREKEVLLKEIHHRVKNNLQIIASLLDLQSESLTDPQYLPIFQDSQHRIRSMALIHEHLYQSEDLAQIDFAQYIQELVYSLFSSYEPSVSGITLKLDIDATFLDIDTAIPCGLILNELVSNSLKHAFPDGRSGEICIGLHLDQEKQLTLWIRDNGVGFPKGVDFRKTESLGLQLVCTLTTQLKGTITLDSSRGTAFQITFKA